LFICLGGKRNVRKVSRQKKEEKKKGFWGGEKTKKACHRIEKRERKTINSDDSENE